MQKAERPSGGRVPHSPGLHVPFTLKAPSAEFLTAFCPQWAESRSLTLFSVGSHPLSGFVVQAGWGTIAAVWLESPP